MADIQGFHVDEIEFTRDGSPAAADDVKAFLDSVKHRQPTDLLILAHGWNNDMAQARGLYRDWLKVIRTAVGRQGWTDQDRRIDVLSVLWPSKQFADEDLIAGGAASFADVPANDVAALRAQIDDLDDLASPGQIEELRDLAPRLETDPAARDRFVAITAEILADTEPDDSTGSDALPPLDQPDGRTLETLQVDADGTDLIVAPPAQGGAAVLRSGSSGGGAGGGAAGLGDVLHGAVVAARNLLNYVTYYKMKNRAGLVGQRGVAPILTRLAQLPHPPRIHLVGHSFGARLATAAILGPTDGAPHEVNTLVLLQAAFSHNAFAENFDRDRDGFFRGVVAPQRCVAGPIMITHTKNDKAVGIAYAVASRIAHQDASFLPGGPEDRFGGLGRNGAVHTPEASTDEQMLAVGVDYEHLDQHAIHNLCADQYISGHGAVRGPEVGEVIVQAIAVST